MKIPDLIGRTPGQILLRAIIAFALGFAFASMGLSQMRFLWNAYLHSGF